MKRTKKIGSDALQLKKETVKNLSGEQLTRAAGGKGERCDPGCSHTLWTICGFPESNY